MAYYKINNGTYEVNDGFCFRKLNSELTYKRIHLGKTDDITNYEVIPEPEAPTEEIDYETAYNELTEVLENA